MLEIVCDANEPVPLAELAVDNQLQWEIPYDGKWSSAQRDINAVMKMIGVRFRRHDSAIIIEVVPKVTKTQRPRKSRRSKEALTTPYRARAAIGSNRLIAMARGGLKTDDQDATTQTA